MTRAKGGKHHMWRAMHTLSGFKTAQEIMKGYRGIGPKRGKKVGTKRKVRPNGNSRSAKRPRHREGGFDGGQGAVSFSNVRIAYRKPKELRSLKRLSNPAIYLQTKKWSANSNQSAQAGNVVDYIAPPVDLLLVWAAMAKFYNGTTATFIKNDAPGDLNALKFMLEKADADIRIVNQGASNAEFELYILMAKKTFDSDQNEANDFGPTGCWSRGLLGQDLGNTPVTPTTPYAKPFESKLFNMTWKCVKTIRHTLKPGETHTSKFSYSPNRILDTNYIKEYSVIKGITYAYYIVQKGVPGDDSKDYDTAAKIGLTRTKLIAVCNNRYKAYMLSSYPRMNTIATDLDADATSLYVQNDIKDLPVDTLDETNVG